MTEVAEIVDVGLIKFKPFKNFLRMGVSLVIMLQPHFIQYLADKRKEKNDVNN
jgi:hypothetical protein